MWRSDGRATSGLAGGRTADQPARPRAGEGGLSVWGRRRARKREKLTTGERGRAAGLAGRRCRQLSFPPRRRMQPIRWRWVCKLNTRQHVLRCIYVYLCTHVYKCVYVCLFAYIYVYMYVCIYVHIYRLDPLSLLPPPSCPVQSPRPRLFSLPCQTVSTAHKAGFSMGANCPSLVRACVSRVGPWWLSLWPFLPFVRRAHASRGQKQTGRWTVAGLSSHSL